MFTLKGNMVAGAAVLRAMLSPHPRAARGAGVTRPSCSVDLMVDSGAAFTVVPEDLLLGLGLVKSGLAPVTTSLGKVEDRPIYRAVLALEFVDLYGETSLATHSLGLIASPAAATLRRKKPPHQGVLGLDVLLLYRLLFDGPGREFTLSCDGLPVMQPPPNRWGRADGRADHAADTVTDSGSGSGSESLRRITRTD